MIERPVSVFACRCYSLYFKGTGKGLQGFDRDFDSVPAMTRSRQGRISCCLCKAAATLNEIEFVCCGVHYCGRWLVVEATYDRDPVVARPKSGIVPPEEYCCDPISIISRDFRSVNSLLQNALVDELCWWLHPLVSQRYIAMEAMGAITPTQLKRLFQDQQR
jgi:hypothetical protein